MSAVDKQDATRLKIVHLLQVPWPPPIHRSSQESLQRFQLRSAPRTPHFRCLGSTFTSIVLMSAMRAVTAVCCCACGSDPYFLQRASSMKLLLRHTHTELALQGVPFARLQLTRPSCRCPIFVPCGNKLGLWSFKACGECVHTISSYKANAHCRLRRWRRRESSPRFERRHLALQHPRPAVWRGSQHRQVQQGIGGSEASAHQDTGSLWA